ncbi:MAG: enoyl-CoA hydratase/isomerase family protein [Nitrospirae bacterium]|nr:enoyl-CoA hydratase/isomerase family protein [Nitrospirota bacterium]
MAEYTTLKVERRDGVVWVTLNRPDMRNAMSNEMGDEFSRVVTEVKNDRDVRVFVIGGEGKSFSSGGDLRSTSADFQLPPPERREGFLKFYPKFLCVTEIEIPTVAMINGHAVGAGMMLALACDIRIMSRAAKLSTGFLRIGLSPGMGGTYLIPRLVGLSKALELIWTSEMIEADEALRVGLVNKVAEPAELRAVTEAFVGKLAKGPAVPMRLVKRAVYRQVESDLRAALEYEALCQTLVTQTEDLVEGVSAFIQKREPEFKGK